MKKIAIIILNWNGWKETIECLSTVEALKSPQGYEVNTVVVDNGSTDESLGKLHEYNKGKNLIIIETKKNLGFAGGNNYGISYALKNGADILVVLNNDTEVDSKLLVNMLPQFTKSKVGIVSPKIYFQKGYEFHKDRYPKSDLGKVIWYAGGIMDWGNVIGHHRGVDEVDHGQYDSVTNIDYASGCCMAITKEVFNSIGLFNEKYFLYYEDNEFSEKAKKAGFSIVFEPSAVVWHKNAASAGGSGSGLQDYYITRNRMLFGMMYAPVRSKVALIRESLKLLQKGRPWQKKGVSDFYSSKFGKGSYTKTPS